jgi:uncharacterized protein
MMRRLEQSPVAIRVVPFVLFVLPLFLQEELGRESPFWIYTVRTLVGVGLIWWMWPLVRELRWACSWEGVLAGVVVFVVWVGLDPFVPSLGEIAGYLGWGSGETDGAADPGWNPFTVYGESSGLAWFFIGVRVLGSTFVVPPLEEVFYRSFLYRYVVRQDFLAMPLGELRWSSFVLVSVVFGLAHHEWLAGIFCGVVYQWLVVRKGRLGDAMTAHAITNFLLGLWVVGRGAWNFW